VSSLYARAGDTFFTRSNTVLGRLIRYGETDKGEAKGSTWANHAGVVVEDGWIGAEGIPPEALPVNTPATVIEALWRTRKGPLKLNGTLVRVFRPVPPYDAAELERFRSEAETYVGDKYGWWKLFGQLGDKVLFGGRKVLTTAFHIKSRPICSFLAGYANHVAQSNERVANRVLSGLRNGEAMYAFGMPPQSADPDEMMDFCIAHPELWEEVK
jgi:hypothetical protein